MRQSCDTVRTYTIRYQMTYKVYTKWHHVKVWDVITNDIIRRYETPPNIMRQYEALGVIETLQEMRHETETPWQCPLNAIRRHEASCKTQEDIADNYHEISLTWDIVKHPETLCRHHKISDIIKHVTIPDIMRQRMTSQDIARRHDVL